MVERQHESLPTRATRLSMWRREGDSESLSRHLSPLLVIAVAFQTASDTRCCNSFKFQGSRGPSSFLQCKGSSTRCTLCERAALLNPVLGSHHEGSERVPSLRRRRARLSCNPERHPKARRQRHDDVCSGSRRRKRLRNFENPVAATTTHLSQSLK